MTTSELMQSPLAQWYRRALEDIHALRLRCSRTGDVFAIENIDWRGEQMRPAYRLAEGDPLPMWFRAKCPFCDQLALIVGDSISERNAPFSGTYHGHEPAEA